LILVLLISVVGASYEGSPVGISALSPQVDPSDLVIVKRANPTVTRGSDGLDEDSTIFFEDFEAEPTDWKHRI
jgi:hypothetical protein